MEKIRQECKIGGNMDFCSPGDLVRLRRLSNMQLYELFGHNHRLRKIMREITYKCEDIPMLILGASEKRIIISMTDSSKVFSDETTHTQCFDFLRCLLEDEVLHIPRVLLRRF